MSEKDYKALAAEVAKKAQEQTGQSDEQGIGEATIAEVLKAFDTVDEEVLDSDDFVSDVPLEKQIPQSENLPLAGTSSTSPPKKFERQQGNGFQGLFDDTEND